MNWDGLWTRHPHFHKLIEDCFENYDGLLKWSNDQENILHDGCVDGALTEVLFPFVKLHAQKVVAIDHNKEMIDLAKKRNQLEGVEYRVIDVENEEDLAKIDEKFDHIFSFFLSQFRTDTRSWLERFHKILNPNSQIFVQAIIDSPIHQSFEKITVNEKWLKYIPPGRAFTDYTNDPIEYFRNQAEAVGFKVELCKLEKIILPVENPSDFVKHIITTHYKNWRRIPIDLQESYLQEHVSNFYERSMVLGKPDTYELKRDELIAIVTKI